MNGVMRFIAAIWRRPASRPDTTSHEDGRPINPTNFHPWQCGCAACAMFWDSKAGTTEYNAWHEAQQGREGDR